MVKIKKFVCKNCKNKFPIYKMKWFRSKELCELCYNKSKRKQKTKRNMELKNGK